MPSLFKCSLCKETFFPWSDGNYTIKFIHHQSPFHSIHTEIDKICIDCFSRFQYVLSDIQNMDDGFDETTKSEVDLKRSDPNKKG